MNKLSNLPPKGTSDWLPQEFRIRKYIFDTWREVCLIFGYQEYMTPLVEYAEVYRAKSGEDVGGKELTTFMDRGGRELAIRPEMTPSVTRMVSRIYENSPKPIRLFSIANFMRNEKPQKGRNREFWQLNCDIFGSNSIIADIEILQIALEIMKEFKAPKGSFTLFLNNRMLIDFVLDGIALIPADIKSNVVRVLDKFLKLDRNDFEKTLREMGLNISQVDTLVKFMSSSSEEELLKNIPEIQNCGGYIELKEIMTQLSDLGYSEYIKFNPSVIRGFDYYDGMIFEVFDNNPENSRAMFGGGRYNGLASLFGGNSFPAVGFAPGDETTRIFLENWNLIPDNLKSEVYFLPILSSDLTGKAMELAQKLRSEGKNVILSLEEQKLGKALEYANKIEADFVVIYGENEQSRGVYLLKDMKSGEQKEVDM